MPNQAILETLMARASTRAYTDQMPSEETIATIVRAGQQAPFAMQLCSVILEREGKHPWGAPLAFLICVDLHRMRRIARKRGWEIVANDLYLLLFGLQDAAYMAQNMVIAAEALDLGSCFIGSPPLQAARLAEKHKLPEKVFPMVRLVVGYPAESKRPRPRYPLSVTLFEGAYPQLTDEQIDEAMDVMDAGFLAEDYYRALGAKLDVPEGRPDPFTYQDYSWTEHISRKLQWSPRPDELLRNLRACGFEIGPAAGSASE